MAVLCGLLQLDLGVSKMSSPPLGLSLCRSLTWLHQEARSPTPYLGTGYKGDANGELALHPPTQEFGPQVSLVLQTKDVQHLLDFFRTLLEREAFQLEGREEKYESGGDKGAKPSSKFSGLRDIVPWHEWTLLIRLGSPLLPWTSSSEQTTERLMEYWDSCRILGRTVTTHTSLSP